MSETCALCRNRWTIGMFGSEPCPVYEMDECDARNTNCKRYEAETEEDYEEYTPSATRGDYGPGNPWDAPGCSISMFI